MSGAPGPPEPTDRQLADIVRYLARLCLEAERGLRSRDHLRRLMEPGDALRSRLLVTLGRFEGGPIRPADVGPAHVTRRADGSVLASVVTRTEGNRWGALTLRLRPHAGRYLIADMHRLHARTRPHREVDRTAAPRSPSSRSRG